MTTRAAFITESIFELIIEPPYTDDLGFGEDLKRVAPSAKWDRDFHYWSVDIKEKDKAIRMTKAYFDKVNHYKDADYTQLNPEIEKRLQQVIDILEEETENGQ